MKYLTIPVTNFAQNCSIVWCEETLSCGIIDPGGDIEKLIAAITKNQLKPEAIYLTHAHIDHVGCTPELAVNGVDGATLTNIAASNTAGGFGLALASSSDVTIDGLSASGNAWGDAAIFPAGTAYQIAGYEAPTNITFEGTLDLSSGAGSISVQDWAHNPHLVIPFPHPKTLFFLYIFCH